MQGASDWPELKGKFHILAQVVLWLHDEANTSLKLAAAATTDEQRIRATLLQAYADMRSVIKTSGDFLTAKQKKQLRDSGLTMLNAYKILSWIAEQEGRARWQLKPKHHHMSEGIVSACRRGLKPTRIGFTKTKGVLARSTYCARGPVRPQLSGVPCNAGCCNWLCGRPRSIRGSTRGRSSRLPKQCL